MWVVAPIVQQLHNLDIENGPYRSVKANAIKVFLSELERGLPTSLPDCRRLFNVEIVVVHPMHKGYGSYTIGGGGHQREKFFEHSLGGKKCGESEFDNFEAKNASLIQGRPMYC